MIVTGGTGGLGIGVTQRMLEAGWRVVVPYVAERELEHLTAHERLELVEADLFDESAVAAVVDAAGESLAALVNLVGGFAAGGRVHETPIADFERQFELNLRPTIWHAPPALPRLLEAGAVQSCASRRVRRCGRSRALPDTSLQRRRCSGSPTRSPPSTRRTASGPTRSSRASSTPPANRAPSGRGPLHWVKPSEIAEVIAFLCSEASAPPAARTSRSTAGRSRAGRAAQAVRP